MTRPASNTLLVLWREISRVIAGRREPVDSEWDEEITLEEWLDCFPKRHLTLVNAAGATSTTATGEAMPPTEGTEF